MAGTLVIEAAELRDRLAGLEPIGLGEDGGTTRLAWTEELAAAEAWFGEQASAAGLRVERDPAGSLWAVPESPGPWWATGSHLDSVRVGGRFDGALGVAAGLAVAERVPGVAVIAFADEEGARFNTPTFGSRALVGRLADDVLARVDDDGVALADAMRSFGVEPSRLGAAASWLSRLCGFVELHIDQTNELARLDVPVGVVRSLAARTRLALTFVGRADHAGTTRRGERRDALAAAARVIVLADELANDDPEFLVTASRLLVEPNAFTTVPSGVRLWIDGRTPNGERLTEWSDSLAAAANELAERTRVGIEIATASRSDGVEFDPAVRAALGAAELDAHAGGAAGALPEIVCFAGHDAGILAPRVPAGMVFVRNATGISHAPDEHVELDDAAVAAEALRAALSTLAGRVNAAIGNQVAREPRRR